ncbi:glycoside hydrolase family 15 protein [Phaffia rhodozyma]|uniref:Glycoside hydrolase family 15 protein n=1 Tax=Phaffia rhodozyma TaxID=264483 RepID=A0A0F7SX13_PHARH|nr:glycoside hydrolase family 15 protein [Phaffia rhodozyma]
MVLPMAMFDPAVKPRVVPGISNHAMIGNLRSAAMVSEDASIESYCVPYFDSPSVFARIVDAKKGGHFSIQPRDMKCMIKQSYLPSSNVLSTKFLHEDAVGQVIDLLVPKKAMEPGKTHLPWLIRRVKVLRGKMTFRLECAPAFNYARDEHKLEIIEDDSQVDSGKYKKQKALFTSSDVTMDLRVVVSGENITSEAAQTEAEQAKINAGTDGGKEFQGEGGPEVIFKELDLSKDGLLSNAVYSEFEVNAGEIVDFIFRDIPVGGFELKTEKGKATMAFAEELGVSLVDLTKAASKIRSPIDPVLNGHLVENLIRNTTHYWKNWIAKSTYRGRWREVVHRQALTLKMLIYEETGAIIAAPTFSLPEEIGGERNWDYRYTWIRDSSFSCYAFIRLGFTDEANAFMEYLMRVATDERDDGTLQIMYTIHGGKKAPEEVLDHLAGHRDSQPVRIGNGAVDHLQLDIYGELLDAIYLTQRLSKPLSWDRWRAVRRMVDWVCDNWDQPDLSIWEVRDQKKHFVYSKIMLWVAVDRGIRLSEKRSLPLPQREKWLGVRDKIYEQVMEKGWNEEKQFFAQSYENLEVLDSAVLVMSLTFFLSAADPRFRSTLEQILKVPELGGLTSNNLVHRYDQEKAEDGMDGKEGAFSLCTLWAVEALTRAGEFDKECVERAETMFEDFLGYGNHKNGLKEDYLTQLYLVPKFLQLFIHPKIK